jgi:hypothetical protein
MSTNKLFKKLWNYRAFAVGGIFSFLVIWRFNKNFKEFNRAITKEKTYDLRKSYEQLNLYRELYDLDNNLNKANNSNIAEKPHRLISVASDEDKEKIKRVLDKYGTMDPEKLKDRMSQLKSQIDYLEDSKTTHQGIKLTRVLYGYEPSEDALKNIRENYNKSKKENNEA